MKQRIHPKFIVFEKTITGFIKKFDITGKQLGKGDRNSIKLFDIEDKIVNIKSFKIPNLFNQIAYRFFRKSKAQRSFEYANRLLEMDVDTPQPIAYYEFPTKFLFKKSYYVSEHKNYDLTYRELSRDLNYPDHEQILRAFTRFTYNLHQKGILFLDHSPGNTLITKKGNDYVFSLVDLNRMLFKPLSFNIRIRNFERLTIHESMVRTMSDEYAKVSGEPFEKIFELMWKSTQEFQAKFYRKKRLKKKLKFWKK